MGHQQVDGHIVHMGQHHQVALFGQDHQLLGHGAVGVGAVVQVELANAPVRPGRRAARQFGLHHGVDALVGKPAGVVRPVAIQPHKGHDGDTRLARLRQARQRERTRVGPRVGHDGAHAAGLHAREHISGRVGAGFAVPRFLVVVQVRIEQGAGVVGRVGLKSKCY
ncbi:hypothetical protein D3C71_1204540 [compost metagenome]